ncbi:MAG TPA: glycosyltransferase family 39 protein [Candidatus Acidoferrum sp.]|nr:glycosyltransferase family 39 protein [Candidatus Acidoferrum sp.]
MERTSTVSTKAALCVLAALFTLSVYRAATCDVTPSEAWNYDRYVSPSWQDSLRQFDLNNHVLNTFLVRISTAAFGRKEIVLRLPSLFAGLLFYWAAWRLCRRLLGNGWTFALAIGLMSLNPLVVDAVGEARGYGMALACWMWALERFVVCLEQHDQRKLNQAAILLALSVTACLSFIVPALGLAVAATMIDRRRSVIHNLWLPMLVFLFVLLAIPLNRVLLSDFAHGATSLRQTLTELTTFSLGTAPIPAVVIRVAIGLLVAAGAIVAFRRPKSEPILVLTSGTALIGLLLLLVAHAKLKAPFPQRGAIYFVPILTLIGLSLFRGIPRILGPLAAACVLIYAVNFPTGPYLDGHEFAGSREIAKAIRSDAGQRPVRIAASPELEPIINYYRTRYRQGNWERIEHKAPEPGYEYYVLTTADAGLVAQYHLQPIRRFPGLLLAAR